ncbi:MAG TPA: superinfection immunity protein [Acetobacteraceae bacterium]|jgi:hypothetical protein
MLSASILAVLLIAYTVPTGLAIHRELTDRTALAVTNLVFGWTVLGWFACLFWAALGRTEPRAPLGASQ